MNHAYFNVQTWLFAVPHLRSMVSDDDVIARDGGHFEAALPSRAIAALR